MASVYIIFSEAINKHYVGFTSLPISERLRKHNSNHKGFTGKTADWEVVFIKKVETKNEALQLEKKIKKKGSKKILERYRVTLGREGRRFESCHPDFKSLTIVFVRLFLFLSYGKCLHHFFRSYK